MRLIRRAGVAVLVLLAVAALTLAVPLPAWRTGHEPFAPLAQEAAPRTFASRLWIDTDPACGEPGWHDPDDCLALLALLRRPDMQVVGVSTVFGNTTLERTSAIAGQLLARLARAPAVPLHAGCAAPYVQCRDNDAIAALRAAMAAGPLTVVALGPLTNVARALAGVTPAQRAHVQVVAVMGRRPGHRFHPSENRGAGAWFFGHGPVLRDLNAALDPDAVAAALDLQADLTLVPYEAARRVLLDGADLDRIAAQGAAGAWIAARCSEWLALWRERVGLAAFYPFDLAAAMIVLVPQRAACAPVTAWVGRDPQRTLFERAPALLVAQAPAPSGRQAAAPARYCTRIDAQVADVL